MIDGNQSEDEYSENECYKNEYSTTKMSAPKTSASKTSATKTSTPKMSTTKQSTPNLLAPRLRKWRLKMALQDPKVILEMRLQKDKVKNLCKIHFCIKCSKMLDMEYRKHLSTQQYEALNNCIIVFNYATS